jgi:hypothetical protein
MHSPENGGEKIQGEKMQSWKIQKLTTANRIRA